MTVQTAAEWDLDEVEVDRWMSGEHHRLPLYAGHAVTPEVAEAIRLMAGRGMTDRQISERLGCRLSRDAVLKIRARRGIPPGIPRTGT